MRLFFAILLCKLVRLVLRLAGRGGTALPGKIALRVCPDMLSQALPRRDRRHGHGHKRQDHHLPHA